VIQPTCACLFLCFSIKPRDKISLTPEHVKPKSALQRNK